MPRSVASTRIEKHEAVCTERYGSINQQLVQMNNKIEGQTVVANARFSELGAQFSNLDSRMWVAAGATVVMACAAIGALLLIIFKH